MTPIKFPYQKISNPLWGDILKFRYHPIKKIALSSSSSFIKTEGYIDTGSQWCLFNNPFAKQLGIKDYTSTDVKIPLSGVGGKQPENVAYFHKLDLYVFKDNRHLERKNAWKIETMIGFLDKEIGFSGILGTFYRFFITVLISFPVILLCS